MTARLPPIALSWRMPPIPAPPHDPHSLLLSGTVGPDPRKGWRAAPGSAGLDGLEIAAPEPILVLEPSPGATRRMSEPSGSFGGLRMPLNAALGPGGDVFLLDPVAAQLKRFDACECTFATVPCFLRRAAEPDPCMVGAGPRRMPLDLVKDPHGISICDGDLYIADSGHARVLRYAMSGFVARGALQLPPGEAKKLGERRWYPFALAFDGRGCLYVSDPQNLRIDVFDPQGRWRDAYPTSKPAWSLVLDCEDRLYALIAQADALALDSPNDGYGARWTWPAGAPERAVVRYEDGRPQEVDTRADLARGFAVPPLPVDLRGHLHLMCAESQSDREAIFDARGNRLVDQNRVPEERYVDKGTYRSSALDSGIEGCQWHRVELRGTLPKGCKCKVSTLSAQIELAEYELAAMPPSAWSEAATASATSEDRWDCLVRSLPGRFLWLKLEFSGESRATPALDAVLVEFPRISLRRYLPAVFGAEPASADFTDRFTAIFDTTLRSLEIRLDRMPALFDPMSAPAEFRSDGVPDFLSWIASWIGIALPRDWPEPRRRRYVKEAARLYGQRGTPKGLWRQLLLFLGFDVLPCLAERPQKRCVPKPRNCGPAPQQVSAAPPPLILEHFRLRRWLHAGRGRLGEDSVLWGRRIVGRSQLSGDAPPPARSGNARVGESRLVSTPDPLHDPFLVYAHRLSVFVPARVRDCESERRAFEQLLARETPAHAMCDVRYVEPRFRVGVQAMIGLDSVVARTPRDVRLRDSILGQGSVLSAPPARHGGPRLRVGDTRVGTSTALT